MRIMPRLNEDVNEEWLSDKGRFIFDGLKTQRLDRPYLRVKGKLTPVSWSEAFTAIAEKVKSTSPQKIGALAGQPCERRRYVCAEGAYECAWLAEHGCAVPAFATPSETWPRLLSF